MNQSKVVLGMHSDNVLNVYVRAGDQLHQTAKLATVNGVKPEAMTTMMADLADALGWHHIAVDPPLEVPPSPGRLPRAGAAPSVAAPASSPRGRRTADQMEKQRQVILDIVSALSEDQAMTVPQIATVAMHRLGITKGGLDTSTRDDCKLLAERGLIRSVPIALPGGRTGFKWCRIE